LSGHWRHNKIVVRNCQCVLQHACVLVCVCHVFVSGACCNVVTVSAWHVCRYSSLSRARIDIVHSSSVPSVGSQLHMPTLPMCHCEVPVQLMVMSTSKWRYISTQSISLIKSLVDWTLTLCFLFAFIWSNSVDDLHSTIHVWWVTDCLLWKSVHLLFLQTWCLWYDREITLQRWKVSFVVCYKFRQLNSIARHWSSQRYLYRLLIHCFCLLFVRMSDIICSVFDTENCRLMVPVNLSPPPRLNLFPRVRGRLEKRLGSGLELVWLGAELTWGQVDCNLKWMCIEIVCVQHCRCQLCMAVARSARHTGRCTWW